MKLKYVTGSVLEPIGEGRKVIAHVANNSGGWGRGFVVALSNKWALPEQTYRHNYRKGLYFKLGDVHEVPVTDDITVCNMIAQNGYKDPIRNPVPLNYQALEVALKEVFLIAEDLGATIHMPRIGAGLGGGNWDRIEAIIN